MSVDRTPKRKAPKRDSVSPKSPPKKKRPKTRTADNLEALLHLLDEQASPAAEPAAPSKTRKSASGRASRPPRQQPKPAGEAPSFMQELARARAELHKERLARIALQEEDESLRSQLTRLDLEAQLDAEQTRHELLNDQLEAINRRLTAEYSRRESALNQRIADAETKVRERDDLIRQARTEADDSARGATELEERFQHERASRAEVERRFLAQVNALETQLKAAQREVASVREQLAFTTTALDTAQTTRQESLSQIRSLQDQLADANQQIGASAGVEQRLRVELKDALHQTKATASSLDERTTANERLEKRVSELEKELANFNQLHAKGQHDSKAVNEQIERLQADLAKGKIDLAAAYEQLGSARLRLANSDRDRDHAQQREAEALRRTNELSEEVTSLQATVQREAAARRKAEAVHKREAGDEPESALFEAELKIERLSRELAASKSVEAAYQQKAIRKVQQVKQELETLRQRLAEIEQRREGN